MQMTPAQQCTLHELRDELSNRAKAARVPLVLITGFENEDIDGLDTTGYEVVGRVKDELQRGIGLACGTPSEIYSMLIQSIDALPGGLEVFQKYIEAFKLMREADNGYNN